MACAQKRVFVPLCAWKTSLCCKFFIGGREKNEYDSRDVVESYDVALANTTEHLNQKHKWYMDCGASKNVTSHKSTLVLVKVLKRGIVTIASGEQHKVEERGNARVSASTDGIKLEKILYAPFVRNTLMSVGKLANHGYMMLFTIPRLVYSMLDTKKLRGE